MSWFDWMVWNVEEGCDNRYGVRRDGEVDNEEEGIITDVRWVAGGAIKD